jgi:hypothetical protein
VSTGVFITTSASRRRLLANGAMGNYLWHWLRYKKQMAQTDELDRITLRHARQAYEYIKEWFQNNPVAIAR